MDIPELLRTLPLWLLSLLLFVENLVILLGAVAVGAWGVRRFAADRVTPPPPPLHWREVTLALTTLVLNTAVTIVGLMLYRAGIIEFRDDSGLRAWLDVPILVVVMDFAMYWLHRIAHHPLLFSWLHATHHEYTAPRPLTLFVLNPAEALAFGGLWLVVVSTYSASWLGMSVYLVLNVASGTIGHLGVEPVPTAWTRHPLVPMLGTSTFHAQHHGVVTHNFGFYTCIWDRCFGTLHPTYDDVLARRRPLEQPD